MIRLSHPAVKALTLIAFVLAGPLRAPSAAQDSASSNKEWVFTFTSKTTQYGAGLHLQGGKQVFFFQNCTVLTGTSPTLDTTMQESFDGGVTWIAHVAFTQLTAAGSERKDPTTTLAPYIRPVPITAGTAVTAATLMVYALWVRPTVWGASRQ